MAVARPNILFLACKANIGMDTHPQILRLFGEPDASFFELLFPMTPTPGTAHPWRLLLALILVASSAFATDRDGLFKQLHGIEGAQEIRAPWLIEKLEYRTSCGKELEIRMGHLEEAGAVPFRGNILYYQGFADSMLNHDPLFTTLTDAGYRIVAFDYPGQGGSSGNMNNIDVMEITRIGDVVLERLERRTAAPGKKITLAWSTGGLAAYLAASRQEVDAVILIAPGIHVRALVGRFGAVTLPTLTSRPVGEGDPHVDPIRPASPLLVPLFAARLLATSIRSHGWTIPASVKGLVVLTGAKDRYVKPGPTEKTLRRQAGHFEILSMPDSLHEVDNEVDTYRLPMLQAVLTFLHQLD